MSIVIFDLQPIKPTSISQTIKLPCGSELLSIVPYDEYIPGLRMMRGKRYYVNGIEVDNWDISGFTIIIIDFEKNKYEFNLRQEKHEREIEITPGDCPLQLKLPKAIMKRITIKKPQ